MKGLSKLIIKEDLTIINISNKIPILIKANHYFIYRFFNIKSEDYQIIINYLKKIVKDILKDVITDKQIPVRDNFTYYLKTVNPNNMLKNVPKPNLKICL